MRHRFGRISASTPGRGCRSSLVLAGLAMTMLLAVLPAFADTPETGTDQSATLTVTPSDGLSDGQVVTVTGTEFPPNTAGVIRECGGTVAAPQCDLTVTATFVTTPAGDIPPTNVTVERIIDTGFTTFNCGAQSCALVASAGGRTSQHHISMAGAGTSSIPPTSIPPTSIPPTSVLPTTVPSTSIPPTSIPAGPELVCTVLRVLLEPFPFLRGLITSLLSVFGCPATG